MSSNLNFKLPTDRPWELVLDEEGKVKLMQIQNGELVFNEPFRFQCNYCGQIAIQPEPKNPKFCVNCQKHVFKPLFPKQLKTLFTSSWHIPWLLAAKPVEADYKWLFNEVRECLRKHIVFKDPFEYDVLAVWTMATWKVDSFKTLPYLLLRGEIETGKTRVLEMLTQLGYHVVPTAGISPAVLRKQVEWFRCTCAIDQAEDQLDRRYEAGQEVYRLVAAGYKRGMFVARCRKDDPMLVDYDDPFSFKAFASTKSFDEAIDSRSLIIDMREATPERQEIDEEWCAKLRRHLLHFRLTGKLEDVETKLVRRTRELFKPLLMIVKPLNLQKQFEDYAEKQRVLRRKELAEGLRSSVVEAIVNVTQRKEGTTDEDTVYISEIKNEFSERGLDLTSNKIGVLLKDMAIEKDRHKAKGVYVNVKKNFEQIRYLRQKYGLSP